MNYRAYLLDDCRRIRASENFAAACDEEALKIASVLHDACSDIFPVGEVWRHHTLIGRLPSAALQFDAEDFRLDMHREIIERRQWDILELEDQLQRSSACVRDSRRLMRAMDELMRICGGPGAQHRHQAVHATAAAGTAALSVPVTTPDWLGLDAPAEGQGAKAGAVADARLKYRKRLPRLRDVWAVVGIGGALFALTVGFYAAAGWVVDLLWGHIAVWLGWA